MRSREVIVPPLAEPLWRVFPWDRTASAGAPFSPEYVSLRQGSGRFDLGGDPPVFYLAESPTHAVGEKIQRYRGQRLRWHHLREFGRPLALVSVTFAQENAPLIANLCDPAELLRYQCRPDEFMSRDLSRTQGDSRRLHDHELAGFRIWSSLSGDWHSTVLFVERFTGQFALRFGTPSELDLHSPPVRDAARELSISIAEG